MTESWEQSALLAVMGLVLAERALGRTRVPAAGGLVVVGLLTARSGGLPLVTAWCWLATAVVAGDMVAYVARRPSGRDPFRILRRTGAGVAFATASVVGAAAWTGGLLVLGRAAGEVGTTIGHLGTTEILVGLGCLLVTTVRRPGQPMSAGIRSR
jgi:membrane protein DedA with SNARE-associated domain